MKLNSLTNKYNNELHLLIIIKKFLLFIINYNKSNDIFLIQLYKI